MLTRDILKVALRSFKNNQLRTFLTILGISVGIGVIVFLVSLGYGMQMIILERIATPDSLMALDVSSESKNIDSQALQELSQIPEVAEAYPVVTQETKIQGNNTTTTVEAVIVQPAFFKLDNVKLSSGTTFNETETGSVVVSQVVLSLLGLTEDNYKDQQIAVEIFKDENKSEIIKKNYKIQGVVDNNQSAFVYVPLESLKEIAFQKYDEIKVRVTSQKQLEAAREAITSKGFYVSAVSDLVEQANQIFTIAKILLFSFGIVALTVSSIGMFNTMTVALLERTQEIGIMKSLGASTLDIWQLFLTESAVIGFLGGITVVVLGSLISNLINLGVNMLANHFGGESVDLFYSPAWFLIFIIFFSSIIGFLTGFYPAKRAAKLNPLDALRYK